MPCIGRHVSPFIVERDDTLQRRERRKKKEKEKEKNKKMGWSMESFLFFSPWAPTVVWRRLASSLGLVRHWRSNVRSRSIQTRCPIP
jgi:hypothetical protein